MNTESTKTQEKKLETLEEATMNVLNEEFGKNVRIGTRQGGSIWHWDEI